MNSEPFNLPNGSIRALLTLRGLDRWLTEIERDLLS